MKKFLIFMLLFVNLQVAIWEKGIMLIPNSHVMAQNMSKDPDPGVYKCWEIVTVTNEVWGFMLITSPLPCNSVVVDGQYPQEPEPKIPQDPEVPYGPIGGGRTPHAESTTPTPSGVGYGHSSTPSLVSPFNKFHSENGPEMDKMLDEDELQNTPYRRDDTKIDKDFDDLHIPDIDWSFASSSSDIKMKICPGDPINWPKGCPTSFEGAVMSEYSYHKEETYGDCYDKLDEKLWENADEEAKKMGLVLHDPNTGLDCTLMKKRDGSGYALVFAGTSPTKVELTQSNIMRFVAPFISGVSSIVMADKIAAITSIVPDDRTDYYQVFYGMDAHYMQAMCNALMLQNALGNKAQITFVGHSLGGGLASLASIVTGCPALAYNPAILSGKTLEQLKNMGFEIDTSNIWRYIMDGDYVTEGQKILDELGIVDLEPQGWKLRVSNVTEGDSHSCKTMIDNISCDEFVDWKNE